MSGMDVSDEEFEELVAEALDGIPPELAALIDNVVVLVEPEPPRTIPTSWGCTTECR